MKFLDSIVWSIVSFGLPCDRVRDGDGLERLIEGGHVEVHGAAGAERGADGGGGIGNGSGGSGAPSSGAGPVVQPSPGTAGTLTTAKLLILFFLVRHRHRFSE